MTHTPVLLHQQHGWTLLVSHHDKSVKRLVVFVHGFRGNGLETWLEFPTPGDHRQWWLESDMLFVDYKSTREGVVAVADRIRRSIEEFFPHPYPAAMEIGDQPARADITSPYEELILVGHSMGGLIIRRALLDAAVEWDNDERPENSRPVILDSTNRLFSPASAGFQPSGWLGLVRASGVWRALELYLHTSSGYKDMQPGSQILTSTRQQTEELAKEKDFEALRAFIVWANPEGVVITDRYRTDKRVYTFDNKNHVSVCKPVRDKFEGPWKFIETGGYQDD
ncbi:esterase/lipase family protein [Rhodococcus sp. JT-3]|uniref:esterase/lipase family protein n=1 Tax=Rhodococcus sp. JT-3 TaxID=1973213 RepID=UPI001303DCA3|nr:alpha/beta fold hydrolase [Rhodococcus sp. JT-3]